MAGDTVDGTAGDTAHQPGGPTVDEAVGPVTSPGDRPARRSRRWWRILCAPGLEGILATEVGALGVQRVDVHPRMVRARMSDRQAYAAHLHLRVARRLLVEAVTVRVSSLRALERAADSWDLSAWIDPAGPAPRVRASTHRSPLWHERAVAERVAAALGGRVGWGDAGPDDPLVDVRVEGSRLVVSVDATGESLHRRPWRSRTVATPLDPTVAAAAVLAGGVDATTPVVDPFCGSGTVAIEAARHRAGLPASRTEGFAFQRWPSFAPGTWASVTAGTAGPDPAPGMVPAPVAVDADPAAVARCAANAREAGVALSVAVADATTLHPPATGGLVVTNPPWGRRSVPRSGSAAVAGTLRSWRDRGWRVVVVAPAPVRRRLGGGWRPLASTRAGGVPVTILIGEPARARPGGGRRRGPARRRKPPGDGPPDALP